jgi:L-2,4-diaminobutyric acid acetyltransferase
MSESSTEGETSFRLPVHEDGPEIWKLIRDSKPLDLNSAYSYLLLTHYFANTCVVVEDREGVAGFVSGFISPQQPDCLFIWQVAVRPRMRGQGLAGRMLRWILSQPDCSQVQFLETTVTPDNTPSRRLFQSFATKLGTECRIRTLFEASLFPEGGHEPEELFRIGPFDTEKIHQEER